MALETADQQATQDQAAPNTSGPAALAGPDVMSTGGVSAAAPTASASPVAAAGAEALKSSTAQAADAALQLRLGSAPPGSFASKLATAADQLGIPTRPDGKPMPGGWARSLVGAAQHALHGANISGNLGDMAASTERVPPGGGMLTGMVRTMAARNQRLAGEAKEEREEKQQDEENRRANERLEIDKKKAQLDNTEANLRMHHTQLLNHQIGVVQPMIAQGVKTVAMLSDPDSGHPTPVAAKDITSDESKQGVIDRKWNLEEYTALPTGQKVVGEDKETGDPIYQTTYTIMKAQGKVTPNAGEIKYLNDNLAADQKIQIGQEFTFARWNQLHRNADDVKAQTEARDKTLIDNKLMKADQTSKLEAVNFGPAWTNALAQAKGDPIAARDAILSNPTLAAKYPNLEKDVVAAYPGFDKLEQIREEARQKAIAKAAEEAQGVSGVPMTDEMKANINALPADKKANLQAVKDPTLQATLYSLALNDGSLDLDRIFPNRKYKGSQQMDMATAVGILKQQNPKFNEQTYRAMTKEYASLMPGTKKGDAIEQYNNVLQHSAELQDTLAALQTNLGPEFYNTAVNKLKSKGWGTAPGQIEAAMEPLKSEFELLMAGGYKPSEDMQSAYQTILSQGSTAGQIGASLKKLAATGGIRLENIDQGYYRLAGKHIPNLVTPDAIAAAAHLGIQNADAQTWSRLQSMATGGVQFQSGIPAENKPAANTTKHAANAPLPPPPPDTTRLVDGNGFYYDIPNANVKATLAKHQELKTAGAQ